MDTQAFKKGKMNKCAFICLAVVCSTTLLADEQIERTIDDSHNA